MYIYIYIPAHTYIILSLGALVPNSRDRHEKQWRPDFTHHKTHPKCALFEKSRLKCTSNGCVDVGV